MGTELKNNTPKAEQKLSQLNSLSKRREYMPNSMRNKLWKEINC